MKLPPQAKKVFTGTTFDVYQWEQEMYDGSFMTYERLHRTGTTDVIAVSGKSIFLNHQSQPTKPDFYSLFGGRVEKGEEYLAAAKRELLEESGMQSDSWELYKTYQPFHKIDWDVSLYIAKDCKKVTSQKLDAGEKIEILECTFDEFVKIVLSEKFLHKELTTDILRMYYDNTIEDFKKKLLN